MSFKLQNKDELIKIGDMFGIVLEPDQSKNEMLAELEKQEVTWAEYQEKVEKEKAARESMVLLKMERANRSYETYGARFTQEHPYVLVTEEQADKILEFEEGFREASTRELKSYYS